MSKIERPKITRGLKLLREHFFDAVDAVQTAVAARNVDAENLATPTASTRISLHAPSIDSTFFEASDYKKIVSGGLTGWVADDQQVAWCAPFTLPPLQDRWSASALTSGQEYEHRVESVMLSFDQRAEGATIMDEHYDAGADAGKLSWDNAGAAYDMRLILFEKQQQHFTTAQTTPEREVFSVDLPGALFGPGAERGNPFLLDDLNVYLRPYRTYLLAVVAPELFDGDETPDFRASLNSLQIELVLESKLDDLQRSLTTNTQNMPTPLDAVQPETITVTKPAAGDPVNEAALQGNLKNIDEWIARKVAGGLSKQSQEPPLHHLKADAAYEVIAVPMWCNFGATNYVIAGDITPLPYMGADDDPTCDRRVIPLHYPFIIHHVIAVDSAVKTPNSGSSGAGVWPASNSFTHTVGVGLLTGFRGDFFGYQQVAQRSWVPATATPLDRVAYRNNGLMNQGVFDFALHSVPLVGGTNRVGAGYITQGTPVFAGKSQTPGGRTQIEPAGGGAMADPVTEGAEQWLEVRWNMEDTSGMGRMGLDSNEVYVPACGRWVYIIGQKPTVGAHDLPL